MGPTRMRLSKPVIAAIAGHAVAGGLELALWCDLRVAEEDAVLGVFCRRWGVPLIDGGTVRLPQLVGLGRALDLILTGRAVAAPEALAMGLVNRVVPHGQRAAAAEALAREIAALPQQCLRSDRASALEGGWLGRGRGDGQRVPPRHGGAGRARHGRGRVPVPRRRGPGRRSRLRPDRYQTYPPGCPLLPRHFQLRARLRALIWLRTCEPPTRRAASAVTSRPPGPASARIYAERLELIMRSSPSGWPDHCTRPAYCTAIRVDSDWPARR